MVTIGSGHDNHAFLTVHIDDGHLFLAGVAVKPSPVVAESFDFLGVRDLFNGDRITLFANQSVASAFPEFLDMLHGGCFLEGLETFARRRGGNYGDKACGDSRKDDGFQCCFYVFLLPLDVGPSRECSIRCLTSGIMFNKPRVDQTLKKYLQVLCFNKIFIFNTFSHVRRVNVVCCFAFVMRGVVL